MVDDDGIDPEADKELKKLFGGYRSEKYRNRDKDEIIESRQEEIEQEERFSKQMALREDKEQELILMREREKKLKKKKLNRLDRIDEGDDDSDEFD